MATHLLSREGFRQAVFARDQHQCVICHEPAVYDTKGWVVNLDPHHVLERRLWDDGGYYLDNGATLCETHHRLAEQTLLSCEAIRTAAGIKRVVLPNQLYGDNDYTYTKWGDVLMPSGIRYPGELFQDESVQKILAAGGVLDSYSKYVKYPRTLHLPWSEKLGKGDRRMPDTAWLIGQEVVVTEKRDGENSSLYPDYLHARSVNSGAHESRKALRAIWSQIAYQIPEGWRICGENLYEQHTIVYRDLQSFFEVFSIWDERNVCLSWEETEAYASMLGLITVPVLYRGVYDEKAIRACMPTDRPCEGYVVRLASEYPFSAFRHSLGKFVSADFVITHGRTTNRQVIANQLASGRKF